MKYWAIITARSGSKRLENKNIKKFINKPLIEHTFINTNNTLLNKVILSTNCDISINNFVSIQSKQKLLNTNVAIKKDSEYYIMAENVVSLNSISASLPHLELFFENGKPLLGGNKKILINLSSLNLDNCCVPCQSISNKILLLFFINSLTESRDVP